MNKYEICVSKSELANYIKDNNIQDKKLFRYGKNDFHFVYPEGSDKVNFFDEEGDFINGWHKDCWLSYVCSYGEQVTPEEFLIAIGYLPEKQKISSSKVSSSKVSPIKAEDIHYICEVDNEDYLSLDNHFKEMVAITIAEAGRLSTIELSPEGLIGLGSDLVRLGVSLRDGTYEE